MSEQLEAQSILPAIPPAVFTGTNEGSTPEIYEAELQFSGPDEEAGPPIEHQWRVFRTNLTDDSITLTVRAGLVDWDAEVMAEQITLEAPDVDSAIWCKITVDEEVQDVVAAVIESGEAIPDDTATEKYWLLAEIFSLYPDGEFYPGIRQIQFEPIRKLGGTATTAATVNHPWKVTAGETEGTWDFVGGTVHVCGQGYDIPVDSGTVNGGIGYVILQLTRDSYTREVAFAEVIFSPTPLESDYYLQNRTLAYVDNFSTATVRQHQFEEIRLFEELVVINGTFKLQAYEISHQNNYDLP